MNGELCVDTGGGTTTRVPRTFASRWVTPGEAGGPEKEPAFFVFHLRSNIGQLSHIAAKKKILAPIFSIIGTPLEVAVDPS